MYLIKDSKGSLCIRTLEELDWVIEKSSETSKDIKAFKAYLFGQYLHLTIIVAQRSVPFS